MAASSHGKLGLIAVAAVWALAAGAGLFALLDYGSTAAEGAAPPARWPAGSGLQRRPDRFTLVMLAHPQCPCTRASLEELAIAAARTDGRLDIHVVFLSSPAFELHGGLWNSAAAIPGATVIEDGAGVEIQKFGVKASGHTLVYDGRGDLVFSGGITASRGHTGENRGREAIIELARNGYAGLTAFPVFGCALQDRRAAGLAGGGTQNEIE
jgi:hypothetical protein